MRTRNLNGPRSRWVNIVAIFLLFAALLSQPAIADTMGPGMEPVATTDGDGLLPPGDWTDQQRAYLLALIERTEAALPAFADPAYLESIGFHDFGAEAPGGYVHYINPAWFDDGHILDPNHPESLLFQRTYDPGSGTSSLVLKAAMFFLPTGTTMDTIPADLAWIPGWHVHPDVCVTDDAYFAGLADGNGNCSQGHPLTGPPMTHVWIVDNGCGHRFAMVDVGGLMCDLHMDMPDVPMPMPTDPPAEPQPTGNPPTTTGTPDIRPGVAQAADAVDAQPTFTG